MYFIRIDNFKRFFLTLTMVIDKKDFIRHKNLPFIDLGWTKQVIFLFFVWEGEMNLWNNF